MNSSLALRIAVQGDHLYESFRGLMQAHRKKKLKNGLTRCEWLRPRNSVGEMTYRLETFRETVSALRASKADMTALQFLAWKRAGYGSCTACGLIGGVCKALESDCTAIFSAEEESRSTRLKCGALADVVAYLGSTRLCSRKDGACSGTLKDEDAGVSRPQEAFGIEASFLNPRRARKHTQSIHQTQIFPSTPLVTCYASFIAIRKSGSQPHLWPPPC
jgi:hypothetical protein